MNSLFKRLPLSLKLFLLVLLPLALTVYLTYETYQEKSKSVGLLKGYLERINESVDISELINTLQKERRHSYSYSITKDSSLFQAFKSQIFFTDKAIKQLEQKQDPVLKNFKDYTYLDSLASTRNKIENGEISPDMIMHFYTTAIFRINTLNIILPVGNNAYLKPVYDDLIAQKLLSEMGTYLGIIRSNFFNALYTQNNNRAILFGLLGVIDVYRSYEKELLIKASPEIKKQYSVIRNSSELKPTIEYIDRVFERFSFDTLYHHEEWWNVSVKGVDELRNLQQQLLLGVLEKMNGIYKKEQREMTVTFIFLIIAVALVFAFMLYTTGIITKMLDSLNTAARKISRGETIATVEMPSNDVIGNLGRSILKINESNKTLADAAEAIGKGKFDTPISARSDEDILGNAIIHMRNGLKEYTMEIEKRKEEFKQVADTAPVLIWMAGPDKLYNFFNKGWLNFTGRKMEQEIGNGWLENIYPADFDRYIKTFATSFDRRESFFMEYRLRRYDGEYRWISDIGTPRFASNGKFEGYIGSCIDIHESKIQEQRKDDFIKMASHELKTPVTSIKGYIQLLQNMYNDSKETNLPPINMPIEASLAAIEKQVEKLTRLISELLDLSQMESGKIELKLQAFDISELVAETVQDFRHTTHHNIIIQKDVAENNGSIIYADKDRIAQVLLNLMTNAVKYSPANKEVKLRIFKPSENHVSVSVEDNGIGIDKKEHEKIFERFYRAEGKIEQTFPGFGIGLFIASEIIQWHKGKIEVKSEKNKGSVFTFTLPVTAEQNFSENGKDRVNKAISSN